MLTETPIIKVRDYLNNKKTDLFDAYDIELNKEFGKIWDLNFKIPYFLYDKLGRPVKTNDKKTLNPSLDYIKNEMIVEFDNKYYLIKNPKKQRDNSGKEYLNVECIHKAIELSYKNIAFLSTKPPEFNPIKISSNILYIFAAKYEIYRDYVVSSTSNTITLSGNASSDNSEYAGRRIAIIDGAGQGYDYRISSYNGTTKTITIEDNLTESLDTSSLVIVHKSKWTIGDINDDFLTDNNGDIKRSFEFSNQKISKCLNDIADRMKGYLTYDIEYDFNYDEFVGKVNLTKPMELYSGVEFRYKKNLNSVTKESDSIENMYTVVFPYGSDNLTINNVDTVTRIDSGVQYDEHVLGQSYIENYRHYLEQGYDIEFCRENFFNDFEFIDDVYVDEDDLYEDAKNKLLEYSIPKIMYKTTGTDLSFIKGLEYEEVDVGYKIRTVDEEIGINFYSNIMKQTINYENKQKSNLQLSNFEENFGGYIEQILNKTQGYTDDNISNVKQQARKSNVNLVKNGGGEIDVNEDSFPDFWQSGGDSSLTFDLISDSNIVIDGENSFRIFDVDNTNGNGYFEQELTNIAQDNYYFLSGVFYALNTDAELTCELKDNLGDIIKTYSQSYKSTSLITQLLQIPIKTTNDTYSVNIKIQKNLPTGGSNSVLYADNIKFEKGRVKTAYVEEPLTAELYKEAQNAVKLGEDYNNVIITLANGIQVFDINDIERLKLGQIDTNKYGLLLKDATGNKTIIDEDGILQTWQEGNNDNIDSTHPLVLNLYVPSETRTLQKTLLRFRLEKFRAYSQGTASGGGSTETTAGGGDHRHLMMTYENEIINDEVEVPTTAGGSVFVHSYNEPLRVFQAGDFAGAGGALVGMEASQGSVDMYTKGASGTHTHEVTVSPHTHNIDYGIYEDTIPTNVTVEVNGQDITTALGGSFNTDQDNLDISSYIITGQWNTVVLGTSQLGRLDASVFIQALMQV